ncbi:MAG: DUF4013 domain-containing protein [Halobacteriales archaeon]
MAAIGDALRYPLQQDAWERLLLIGGILMLFGFLIIPLLVVYGYIVRVIKTRLEGADRPPAFGEWGSLLIDGLKAFGIGFIYLLIPLIVGTVTFGGSIAAIAAGGRGGAAVGVAGLAAGMVVSFVLSLLFGYVAVAALVHFAHEDRFGAAFEFGAIKTIVLTEEYAIAWGLAVVVLIGASVVTGVLNLIPLFGTIFSVFVAFYIQVVAAKLWADGYKDARSHGEEVEMGGPDPTI